MTDRGLFFQDPVEPRPNAAVLTAALREQVDRMVPNAQFGRELSARIEAVLSPLLTLVDVPGASADKLASIFGRSADMELRARAQYDPVISMLLRVVIDQQRRLEALEGSKARHG